MTADVDVLCSLIHELLPTPSDCARYEAILVELSKSPPIGFDVYCRELLNRSADASSFYDYLAEARVAMLFVTHGFVVEMQRPPRPDLRVCWQGYCVNIEIKHFREKQQDAAEREAMIRHEGETLVSYGDTSLTEGTPSWKQVFRVLRAKQRQLVVDEANFIAFVSDTDAVEEVEVESALNEATDRPVEFDRLSGVILVSNWISASAPRGVYLYPITKPDSRIPERMMNALSGIL